MKRPSREWRLALSVLALACSNPAQVGTASIDVSGPWSYFATSASSPTTLTGTMTFNQSGMAGFSGALDAEQRTSGQVQHVVGIVSGRTLDSARVDFDLVLELSSRRHHIGKVVGDSITGTWLETTSTGIVASGAFRGRRSAQP
jgi:hypothetical protein